MQARVCGGTDKENDGKLLADGLEVLCRGHEVQHWVLPHWNYYPPLPFNALIPVLILGSSDKCQFASLSVLGKDNDPVAVSIFSYLGFNQACNDPFCFFNSLVVNWGTVRIGFTLGDFFAGIFLMGFDAAVDVMIGEVAGWMTGKIPNGLLQSAILTEDIMRGFSDALLDTAIFFEKKLAGELFNEITKRIIAIGLGEIWNSDLNIVNQTLQNSANELADAGIKSLVDSVSETIVDAADWALHQDDDVRERIANMTDEEIENMSNEDKIGCLNALNNGYVSDADEEAQEKIFRNWQLDKDQVYYRIDNMKDKEIKNMSNDDKIDYINVIRDGTMSDADRDIQGRIYRNWPLDDDFKTFDDQKRNEFLDKLKNDETVQNAQDNWDTLTTEEKKEVMQQVVNLQSETYGYNKTPDIELYNSKPQNNMISNGLYANDKIYLNTDPSSKFASSFEEAVDVVSHENAHHYQHELAESFENGDIEEDHATYEQARIFSCNFATDNAYVKPEEDFNTYELQPVESHSNRMGRESRHEMVMHKIKKNLKKPIEALLQ